MSVTDTSPDVGKARRIGRADNECGDVAMSHSSHAKCDNPVLSHFQRSVCLPDLRRIAARSFPHVDLLLGTEKYAKVG